MGEKRELWDAYNSEFEKLPGVTLVRGEESTIPNGTYHLVVHVLVKHVDGTFLCMQRDFRKHYPGMWEASASGSALQGETPYEGALRELREETGVTATELTELARFSKDSTHACYVEYLCITDCDKDSVTLQEGETIAYRWADAAEIGEWIAAEQFLSMRMMPYIDPAYGQKQQDSGVCLETERLILRPWREDDAEENYRYAKDPRVGPAAGWPPHTCIEDTRKVIREILMVPETYAIVLKETGLPIGSIGLHFQSSLAKNADEAELGYWVGVPYWGQGIAPEASREMLRHAFEDLKLARVWCGYYEGNEKSKRVQEKLGFRLQGKNEEIPVTQMGETRVCYINLLTREEWEKLR